MEQEPIWIAGALTQPCTMVVTASPTSVIFGWVQFKRRIILGV